ncbi:MAG TPA: hypothetical protein VEO54_20570 [Thermoanaerobaculia bacterium]|nr:hypothetical protein [Thermoanaerobaculia bacterium]
MTPDYDVFVSHASEDKARFVDSFVAALEARGLKVWYDAKLSALWNQEATFGGTRILPIRLDLDHATMTARSPLLAARAALGWELGVRELAARELFGRETELPRLEAMLAPGASVRVAASIEGLAGVGKTELALHLVDRLSASGRFPGGIFWLDAENPDLTVAWGTTIAHALGVGAGAVEERAAIRRARNRRPAAPSRRPHAGHRAGRRLPAGVARRHAGRVPAEAHRGVRHRRKTWQLRGAGSWKAAPSSRVGSIRTRDTASTEWTVRISRLPCATPRPCSAPTIRASAGCSMGWPPPCDRLASWRERKSCWNWRWSRI